MGIWSSTRSFYRRWKSEVDIYGCGSLLFFSAIITEKYKAAAVVLLITLAIDAMRRWGEPYRQAGEQEMERRRRANQDLWGDRFSKILSRALSPREDIHPSAPETPSREASRLIPRPHLEDSADPPPESPAPIQETDQPVLPPRPPVTHDT